MNVKREMYGTWNTGIGVGAASTVTTQRAVMCLGPDTQATRDFEFVLNAGEGCPHMRTIMTPDEAATVRAVVLRAAGVEDRCPMPTPSRGLHREQRPVHGTGIVRALIVTFTCIFIGAVLSCVFRGGK